MFPFQGKKGRKFIDKKRDVLHTFKVVARSQRDPLAADETAPQGVLQSVDENTHKAEQEKYGIYFDDDYDYLQHLRGVREAVEWDNLDLEVYTIRNEDTKDKKKLEGKKLVLPSSAFESYVEEPIGLLNKAAPVTGPRPELDPDIVAELDDDFLDGEMCNPDEDGALPDNFVLMLNSENPVDEFDEDGEWEDCDEDEEIWGNGYDRKMPALEDAMEGIPPYSKFSTYRDKGQDEGYDADEEERDFSSDFNDSDDEERDEVCSLEGPPRTFRDEETKSHFTSYSLSSSVLRRNELLSQLDGCFEEKFLREYQDEQVGALDGEDIDGYVDEESLLFKQVMDQSRKQMKEDSDEENTRIVKWIKDMQQQKGYGKEEKEEVIVSDDEHKEKWDCESILSTYSTLYNHPRTITDPPRRKKIAINPRTGIPVEHEAGGLTRKALAQHDLDSAATKDGGQLDTETLITSMSAISFRPSGETPEERRFRKKALKELRRERRIEKKINRAAFKEEKKRQEKIIMNNRNNTKISLM